MANIQMVEVATVVAEQCLLQGTVANVDGISQDFLWLPPGYGTCIVVELSLQGTTVATMLALDGNTGLFVTAFNGRAGGGRLGDIGVSPIYRVSPTKVVAVVRAENPVEWRDNGSLLCEFPELDTNAVPTVDYTYVARVQRLRATT